MTPTLTALVLLGLWSIGLTVLIALTRVGITMKGGKAANEFAPGGEDIGGFVQRLARAHANCYENLPIFGAILLTAVVSGQAHVSDPWAVWIFYARIAQSLVHIASTSVPAVLVRFGLYLVQVVLLIIIALKILSLI